MGKSQMLYEEAKKLIPGGTQLLSKRPELFLPGQWPAYFDHTKGCKVWDLDGNEYRDMSYMGIGANVLGYCDLDVDEAVHAAISKGTMCTLNAPEEVELAKLLLRIHPWAGGVRYSKTGGEALAIAVRIARAYTGKDVILFCGYHGWSDWYISANIAKDQALDNHLLAGLSSRGVPRGLAETAIPFEYNNQAMFQEQFEKYKGRIATVVMETVRNKEPEEGFLELVREKTQENGIVLIADEVSAGFRISCGGAHLHYGITPDMAVFAKAMGNGYPISAVVGKKEIMDAAQTSFISSTNWTERIGFCAAIATIEKYEKNKVEEHLIRVGNRVKEQWAFNAKKENLLVEVSGIAPLAHFEFLYDNALVMKTFYTQEMLKRGFLATNAFYSSYAHKDEDIEKYSDAIAEVFHEIAEYNQRGQLESKLEGKCCQTGFQRLA